jgi:hypothetical protein
MGNAYKHGWGGMKGRVQEKKARGLAASQGD